METPPEPARSLDQPAPDPSANYKNWNREPAFLRLQWSKTADGGWWLLNLVEPSQLDTHGVFVIWRNGGATQVSAVLYVGRGSLRDEFARCRRDPLLRGDSLYVTWATVQDVRTLDAIGAYLYQQLRPMWGEVVPMVPPLPVNVPFAA